MGWLKRGLFIVLVLLCCSCRESGPSILDSQGHQVSLATLNGHWVIINYWADWCESCAFEVPELNKLAADATRYNLVLYGVNDDELQGEELKAAINKLDIRYPILLGDPQKFWPLQSVEVLPTTFIIDPAGHLNTVLVGATKEAEILNIIHQSKAMGAS